MKRSAGFLAVLMFSAVVTILLTNSSSAIGGNCQGKLVGNAYDCVFEISNGTTETTCVDFETGGLSSSFDLFRGTDNYGCACQTTGSFKSPSFDASANAFECATISGLEITGKVAGDKLSGQGSASAGESSVFSCTKRTTPGCG